MKRLHLIIAATLAVSLGARPLAADDPPSLLEQFQQAIAGAIESVSQAAGPASADVKVTWHETLDDAIADARENGKPIFVVVGAPWCGFCEKLEAELKGDTEIEIASKWVLAKINADAEVNDARELQANALPALRLLSSDGIVTESRDGYAPADELTRWLDDKYELAKARMPTLLTKDIAELDESEIETLVGLMAVRDVTARRVVLNRLSEMPQHAVHPTIDLLADGNLAHQLSALQLLRRWQAPVDGIDPWEKDSVNDAVVARLKAWGTEQYPEEPQ